jgi:hypothetical protein
MMSRFIRYIVHQRIQRDRRCVGLFAASYFLRDECELFAHERKRLGRWLSWFERELTVPPHDTIPPRAIFWYADVGRYAAGMWELAQVLREYGITTELITAHSVGMVVYRDRHQLAAIPPRRAQR